jgi:hypothetical protein
MTVVVINGQKQCNGNEMKHPAWSLKFHYKECWHTGEPPSKGESINQFCLPHQSKRPLLAMVMK